MDLVSALVLGLVQGITEFLPVSSSAHLIFFHTLFPNFSQPGILFDVFLHAGTLIAVLIYFRKTLLEILFLRNLKLGMLLLVGTIPAALIGYLFNDWLEASFSSVFWAAATLIVTGVFNWFVHLIGNKELSKDIGFGKAILIGLFQALAIIPGISRSSSTIFAGVLSGVSKKQAAEFSFLLSIPAIAGAVLFELVKHGAESVINIPYFAGFIVSALVGYWSIGFLLKLVVQEKYKLFAIYCWVVGALVLGLEML